MTPDEDDSAPRQPHASPGSGLAGALAGRAASAGITLDAVPVFTVVFSILAAVCLMTASDVTSSHWLASLVWLGAAACIVLRQLCSMIGGRMAKPAAGGLFVEVADRIADMIILMAAGYSNDWVVKLAGIPLGWVAAVLAMMTAFIRAQGAALTGTQTFAGPMARPHRMIVIALACLGALVEQWTSNDGKVEHVMQAALAVIIVGSAITCVQRLRIITKQLRRSLPR
jgi:phosphatidylglycerophosphate synthase